MNAPPPDLEISVWIECSDGKQVLMYLLHSASGKAAFTFKRVRGPELSVSAANFSSQIFEQIEKLHHGFDIEGQVLQWAEVGYELESLGRWLYRSLFPLEMKTHYRRFRKDVRTLQITSTEAAIPWELVKPYDDSDPADVIDDDFLCAQFQLTRWLSGSTAPKLDFPVRSLAYIGGSGAAQYLSMSSAEKKMLADLAQRHRIQDASPSGAEFADLENLLKTGKIDLLHFVGHGDFLGDHPAESKIVLADRPFRARNLIGPIQTRMKKDRPLVVFNACRVARQGWSLAGIDGWVQSWVNDCECGAFIGPLWIVDDEAAYQFAYALYYELDQGRSLGEAALAAREVVRKLDAGRFNWLAFAVYGQPNARVTFGIEEAVSLISVAAHEVSRHLRSVAGKSRPEVDMPLSTAPSPVREALSGSLIWEEYRGDFAQARTAAEAQVLEAREGEPHQLGCALLTRGLVRLLQGEPAAALGDLKQAEFLLADDAPLRALVFAYTSLALRGCFHIFPDGAGGVTLEIQDRWDLAEAIRGEERHWNELAPELGSASVPRGSPDAVFEAGFVFHIVRMIPLYRQLLDGSYVTPPERVARQRGMMMGILRPFLRGAEEKGAPLEIVAWIFRTIADIHRRLGEGTEAHYWLGRAFERSAQAGDVAGMAVCRMMLGDWRAAPLSSPAAWNLLLQEGSADSSLAPLRERLELGGGGVDAVAAETVYAEAELLFRQAGARRGLAALELRRGFLRRLEGDFGAVVAHAERAEEIFAAAGDLYGVQLARAHQVLARIGLPEIHEEEETVAEIGRWGRQEGSFAFASGLGLLFGRMGRQWLLRDGDLERALAAFRQARRLYEALGAPGDAARTLADEGETYRVAGEYDASLVAYENALDRFLDRISARPTLATSAWQQALQTADQVLELQLQRRDADGLERSAARFRELRDREPPLDRSDLHGPDFRDIPQRRIADRLANISVLAPLCRGREAFEDGRPEEAQPSFEAALVAARAGELDGRELLEAQVLAAARRFAEAAAAFARYLDHEEAGPGGTSWMFLEDLVDRVSRIGPAGQAVAAEHPLFVQETAAEFFVKARDYPRAKAHLEALEAAAGPDWWRRRRRPWESLAWAGALHEALGRPDLALELYDTAIRLLDERWSLLRRDDLKIAMADAVGGASLHLRAARAALSAGATESGALSRAAAARAFGYAEQGKARSLLDLLAASTAAGPASDPTGRSVRQLHAQLSLGRNLLAREREQQQPDPSRIVQLGSQIQETEARLHRIEADWLDRSGAFPQAKALDLAQVQERLPAGSALLFYFFHQDDLMIWAITADGEVRVHRAELDTRVLSRRIREYQTACYDSQDWVYGPLGNDLAQVLLAPLAEVLDACRRLILVPHGAAHLLPFAVLPWRGEFLAATHVLSYLPSASSLQFLRPEPAAGPPVSLLAVGNPARMSYIQPGGGPARELSPLRGAAAEAAFVASLYPEGEVLLEEQATREAVKERLGRRQVLHLATHGVLSNEAPLLSSIQLADGGSLSVHDLLGEHLEARLVVLSACETARGRRTGGDDVLGLTRGLLAAGANAALVSLWTVSDSSTALLMSAFHRRLRLGDPPALALQSAQTWLRSLPNHAVAAELEELRSHLGSVEEPVRRSLDALRSGESLKPLPSWKDRQPAFQLPYFWAPFILVGGD